MGIAGLKLHGPHVPSKDTIVVESVSEQVSCTMFFYVFFKAS